MYLSTFLWSSIPERVIIGCFKGGGGKRSLDFLGFSTGRDGSGKGGEGVFIYFKQVYNTS